MAALIEALGPEAARARQRELADILVDCVDGGASVGFLPPLAPAEAARYWSSVADAIADGSRVLLVGGPRGGPATGTVQLDLCTRANGLHRAEVVRLLVHRAARRQGLGRALMEAIEAEARRRGRTTLVLDTREGDPSERLYRSLGWQRAGVIPRYARSADGALHGTAYYYKLGGAETVPPGS
jgi:ribosomal protein S18 acetylase RimI-like enzyme